MSTDRPTLPDPRAHLTDERTRLVLLVQNEALAAARRFLADTGVVEMLMPIIGPVTDPGVRGSKQVDIDYYGHRYRLMTSAILYKQASLLTFDRVYTVAANVRLEPAETAHSGRHLAEFHQIDVELAGATRDDAMRCAEGLVRAVVAQVRDRCADELERLGRDPDAFGDVLAGPFDQLTHAYAVSSLNTIGHDQRPDTEIDWAGEKLLSQKASRPFFLLDYPVGCRGFYDREDPQAPGRLKSFDLIAPEGFGELCSGGERESDYRRIITRMRETGENPGKYQWYLDLVRAGIPGSAGFGIGLERLVRYLTGVENVWQATAFPKLAGTVSP